MGGILTSTTGASITAPEVSSVYYSVLIADTVTDAILAEAPIAVNEYTRMLNDTGTLRGSLFVPAMTMHGVDAAEATLPVKRTVYLMREGVPVWGGPITGASYDSDADVVELDASDWFWILDRRKVLPDPDDDPPTNIAEQTVTFTDDEQCDIVRELLRLAQLGVNRDLMLIPDEGVSGIFRDRTYYGYELRNFGTVLRQLANVIDGPDIRFDVGFSNDQPTPLRVVRIGTPMLGAEGDAHDWEYGGNLSSYTYPLDPSEHCDRFFAVGDGTDVGTPIEWIDRTGIGEDLAGWPGLDADEQYSSVIELPTLAEHALDQLARRRGYRVVADAKINGNITPRISDYAPGDYARFVAANGYHELDETTRIVGDRVSVDPQTGDETVDLMLAPVLTEGG